MRQSTETKDRSCESALSCLVRPLPCASSRSWANHVDGRTQQDTAACLCWRVRVCQSVSVGLGQAGEVSGRGVLHRATSTPWPLQKSRGWQTSNHHLNEGCPRGVQENDECRDRPVPDCPTEASGRVLQEFKTFAEPSRTEEGGGLRIMIATNGLEEVPGLFDAFARERFTFFAGDSCFLSAAPFTTVQNANLSSGLVPNP